MSLNSTPSSHPPYFLLTGIPGLEEEQFWIAFPFFIIYGIALLGNITLLLVIRAEPSLHEPMFFFLAVLAFTDLVLATSVAPKMLSILWLGWGEIEFPSCLTQMFFIHAFSAVESGVLTAMALDRCVAICCPLRHSSILTVPVVVALVAVVLLRGVLVVAPISLLLQRRRFCRRRIIAHCYCEHMAVVKLACGDSRASVLYGLLAALLVSGSDLALISASYGRILAVVSSLPSREARRKALSTCSSHLCVILAFYTPLLFTCLAHRFGPGVSPPVHITLASLYLLLPPALNPIVYGVRTKKLWDRVVVLFQRRAA